MFLFSDDPLFTDEELFLMCAASGGKTVKDTATGNPLTFITDVSKPLKSLLIPFTPQQEGSGDPSPQNIRSILPWNGLTVWNGGKNLFDESEYQHIYTDPDYIWEGVPYRCKYIQLSPNTNYTISSRAGTTSDEIVLINNRQQPNIMPFLDLRNASQTITFKTDETGRLYIGSVNGDDTSTYNRIKECKIQIEVGSEESAYEEHHPITKTDIVFPSPVYGGTPDVVSGVLTVQRVSISKKWSEWEAQSVGSTHTRKTLLFNDPVKGASTYAWSRCNVAPQDWNTSQNTHFYIDENKAYVWLPNDTDGDLVVQVAGVLVTPQEIQLTPQQITALVGDNTIWSDADGSMTAVYLKKG